MTAEIRQLRPKSSMPCSFCRKPLADVRHMVIGDNVFICNECVEKCASMIAAHDG